MSLIRKLKNRLIPFSVTNISCSQAVASGLPGPSTVVPNAYDSEIFRLIEGIERNRELVFLGRLVSDKGCDTLLTALHKLKLEGLKPRLTIIGSGEEEELLKRMVDDLGINEQVEFTGAKKGDELVRLLNQHQMMVVPSLWNEPFGIVALEGIACGCVVIGTEGGGLPEAIGPCGVTFPNGDSDALALLLGDLLMFPHRLESFRDLATTHLANHTKEVVAQKYLEVLSRC
jgi:glycosyltransferase involved in cell wall biosynthesis